MFCTRRFCTASPWLFAAAALLLVCPAAAQENGQQDAAGQQEAEPADPYAVPDGKPAELVKYVEGLLQQPASTPEDRKKWTAAILAAADKILAGEAGADEVGFAVDVKTRFLSTSQELEAFVKELKDSDRAKLARPVEVQLLQRQLREALRGPRAEAAKNIETQIGRIKTFLAQGPIARQEAGLAMQAAQMAEMIGDDRLTLDTYTSFGELFAKSGDQRITALAKTFQGVVRRLTLPGKKIKVEGTVLGNGPLDWESYRGKVVLVDFWATWCGPCVHEVPNMKKAYELYHDLGFDIVGISLDRSREALEGFLEKREIPWTILYSDDGPSPTVEYYGVMGIPTMVLVDQKGKVVSLRARGGELLRQLEKLLGPVEEKEAEKEPEKEPDKKKGKKEPEKEK